MSSTGTAHAGLGEAGWTGLHRLGGVAALVAGVVFRRNWAAEYMLLRSLGVFREGPTAPPADPQGWFVLLESNLLAGLTLLIRPFPCGLYGCFHVDACWHLALVFALHGQ